MQLLDIDEVQATAILDMQLRRLAALERQRLIDEYAELEARDRRAATRSWPRETRQRRDRPRRARRDRGEVRRRAAHPAGPARRRRVHGGPDRRGGRGRHDHPHRLREAHQDRPLPGAAARRQGHPGRGAEAGRHRRALLRHLHAQLDPVLHQQGPGLPGEGVRAAGGQPGRPRPARGQPARLPAGRADRAGHPAARLRGRAVPGAGDQARAGEEDQADRLRLQPGRRHRRDQPARGRRADRRRR